MSSRQPRVMGGPGALLGTVAPGMFPGLGRSIKPWKRPSAAVDAGLRLLVEILSSPQAQNPRLLSVTGPPGDPATLGLWPKTHETSGLSGSPRPTEGPSPAAPPNWLLSLMGPTDWRALSLLPPFRPWLVPTKLIVLPRPGEKKSVK